MTAFSKSRRIVHPPASPFGGGNLGSRRSCVCLEAVFRLAFGLGAGIIRYPASPPPRLPASPRHDPAEV